MSNALPKTAPEELGQNRVFGPFLKGILTLSSIGTIILAIIYIFGIVAFGKTILEIGYLYLLLAMLMPMTFLIFPPQTTPPEKIPRFYTQFSLFCHSGLFLLSRGGNCPPGMGVRRPV
jgi:hypothetical protein